MATFLKSGKPTPKTFAVPVLTDQAGHVLKLAAQYFGSRGQWVDWYDQYLAVRDDTLERIVVREPEFGRGLDVVVRAGNASGARRRVDKFLEKFEVWLGPDAVARLVADEERGLADRARADADLGI